MKDQLVAFLQRIKNNPNVRSLNEAAAIQAIVFPILKILGWDIDNAFDEVIPQFTVEGGKVDFCLKANSNEVFLEPKKPVEDLDKHQDQLLKYSFARGVELAVLTNCLSWEFFLPLKKGEWKTRRCYTIDIVEQDSGEVAQRFIDFLSKTKVSSGEAVKNATLVLENLLKQKTIEENIPQAWNKVTSEPDPKLVELLVDVTGKICGVKPETYQVKNFLDSFSGKFQLLPQDDSPEQVDPAKVARSKRSTPSSQPPTRRISQDDLIPHILRSIQNHGGRAPKETVEKEVYQKFKDIFEQPWYQKPVGPGVPSWQHNIDWARNTAKLRGLIKPPSESGRGYWELTELGKKTVTNV